MSDVYGFTCRKLKEEDDADIIFRIWVLVNQICIASRIDSNNLTSSKIMKFLEISLPPRELLVDYHRFRLINRNENNIIIQYVKNVLNE